MAYVGVAGTDGRELAVIVNGATEDSQTVSGGQATFFLLITSMHLDDATISFRYLDGAEEETETLTGAEWRELLDPE